MGEIKTGADSTAAPGSKIDRETAESELILFCENNRIEHDENAMNDEEKETFSNIKKRFIDSCMEGRVEVDGRNLKYTVSEFSPENFSGNIITIKRPGGHAFAAMDGWKDHESVHRLMGFMSALTGKEVKYFSKIDAVDWQFISAVSKLFLSL
jgi:hypothetical protein